MIGGRHSSDHLPSELLSKARLFFDRLSPRGAPIRYHDFAVRWPEYQNKNREAESENYFPITFLDCLRRVTPPNGMLTFERFCAGLRLAVQEERDANRKTPTPIFGRQQILNTPPNQSIIDNRAINSDQSIIDQSISHRSIDSAAPKPPTRGMESAEKTKQLLPIYGSCQSMSTTTNHPPPYNAFLSRSKLNLDTDRKQANNKLNALLARSTPQLCEKPYDHAIDRDRSIPNPNQNPDYRLHPVPNRNRSPPQQKMQMQNQPISKIAQNNSRPSSVQSTDTNGSLEGIMFREKSTNGHQHQGPKAVDNRRHTMIETSESNTSQSKHSRLMQEEKQLLTKALDTANRLHNWYNERLSSLETREKFVGKHTMIPLDYAVHEEKLNFLRAHITEVNRRAVALMESSDKGFPWHMNLDLHRNIPQPADDQLMWMKRQNKMLTNEVGEKSERVSQLESEKARLLKQLCESPNYKQPVILANGIPQQYQQQNSTSGMDSGFHSLTHQTANSAPQPTPQPPSLPPPNGHHQRHPNSNPVYATPSVNANNETPPRYREPAAPHPPQHQHQRVYAELHKPPTERQRNGVLATLM